MPATATMKSDAQGGPELGGVPPPYVPRAAKVLACRQETADIFTLELEAPDGMAPFAPGQFNMLYAHGVGEAAISLSGRPAEPRKLVHTIRSVGSVTGALARLRPGDRLGVRGPYGAGWPLEAAQGKDLVLITGGIGLAPLRPVLYEALRRRGEYGRVVLLHGIRSPADHLFADEIAVWERSADLEIEVAAAQADATWPRQAGMVTALFPRLKLNPRQTLGLMCGPEIMMRVAVRELEGRGVPGDQLYVTMERNMQCAVGFCGHCQFGPSFVCMDGPVFRYDRIHRIFEVREA